jgi:hypothetical protein
MKHAMPRRRSALLGYPSDMQLGKHPRTDSPEAVCVFDWQRGGAALTAYSRRRSAERGVADESGDPGARGHAQAGNQQSHAQLITGWSTEPGVWESAPELGLVSWIDGLAK